MSINVEIVEFEVEHLEQMDMREHEASTSYDLSQLKGMSVESKTAIFDGEIVCCWGVFDDNGIWQIPSIHISKNCLVYAKRAAKVVRELIKDKGDAYSLCLDDELHDRWMRFIGFKKNPDIDYEIDGCKYFRYEVA
jgi:hypothetical protein